MSAPRCAGIQHGPRLTACKDSSEGGAPDLQALIRTRKRRGREPSFVQFKTRLWTSHLSSLQKSSTTTQSVFIAAKSAWKSVRQSPAQPAAETWPLPPLAWPCLHLNITGRRHLSALPPLPVSPQPSPVARASIARARRIGHSTTTITVTALSEFLRDTLATSFDCRSSSERLPTNRRLGRQTS